MTQQAQPQSGYFAFISYKREDEAWARWLQRRLEYYRMPSAVRRERPDVPEAIRPVFKDTTDLEPGILAQRIKDALDDSKYLIVVCSPRSAQSEWVSKEVQTFIDSGRTDRIIPFIIGGTPNAADPTDECFPTSLRKLKGERELLGANINEMGRDAAVIKVIAGMFGLRFDSLWQRYKRTQRRRRIIIMAAVAILSALALGVASYIWRQNLALDSANASLKERNAEIARAYADLSASNTALVAANDSVARAYGLLSTANDSLDLTNGALATANDNLAAEKLKLQESNSALYEQIIESTRRNAEALLERKDILGALHMLSDFIKPTDHDNGGSDIPPHISMVLHQVYDSLTAPGVRPQPIGVFKAESQIKDIAYSPDGKYLIYITNNGVVTIIDIGRHYRISAEWLLPFGEPKAIDIHPTLNHVAITGEGGSCVIDVNGRLIADLGKTESSRSIRYSRDGRYLAHTTTSGITIFDTDNYSKTDYINRHDVGSSPLNSAEFDKNSGHLLIASSWCLQTYDLKARKIDRIYAHTPISRARYSHDYKHILLFDKSDLNIYDTESGEKKASYMRRSNDALMFGKNLILGMRNPAWIGIEKGDTAALFFGHGNVAHMAVHPKMRTFATARDGIEIALYNIAVHEHRTRINELASDGVAVSPDNRLFANCLYNTSVAIFDVSDTREPIATLPIRKSCKAAFMPDSKRLIVAQSGGHIGLWDINGRLLHEFADSLPGKVFNSVAISRDGVHAFVAGGDCIHKYDIATGRIVKTVNCGGSAHTLSFNHRGDRIASTSTANPCIRIWDPATLTHELNVFPQRHDLVNDVKYSPDDKYLAVATYNRDIRVLDLTTQTLSVLKGHTSRVQSLDFADNNTLISVGGDGRLIIWDIALQQPRHIYNIKAGLCHSCDFIPGENIIVTADAAGTTIIPYPTQSAVLEALKPYL